MKMKLLSVKGNSCPCFGEGMATKRAIAGVPGAPGRRVLEALLLVVAAAALGCGPGRSLPADETSATWQRLDKALEEFRATERLPGLAVVVLKGPDVAFARGYGLADLDRRTAVTPRTVFPIGSIEKQFTAAAIMRLLEQGKIRLEEPITRYLPQLDTNGERITIADMLHQVSGLQESSTKEARQRRGLAPLPVRRQWGPIPDRAVGEGFDSTDDIGSFQGQPLYFPPGSRFSYSQPNYDLLCYVIAALSGKTYYEAIADVARAAGLDRFHPEWTPRPPGDDPDVAQGYRATDDGFEVAWESNLGSAWTTAVDLARWGRALETGRVVSRASYARMTAPVQLSSGRVWPYGFGLGLSSLEGRVKYVHTGRVLGFYAVLARYPEDDLTIAMMTNLGGASAIGYRLEPRVARLILGLAAPRVRDEPLSPREQSRFTGAYDAGAFQFDVVPDGERLGLIMRVPGDAGEGEVYDRRTLLYQGDGVFVAEGAPEWREVSFEPGHGRATEIALGRFAEGVRTPRQ